MSGSADLDDDCEHYACYAGGVGEPYCQPFIGCSCGFGERCETFAEAGALLDEHLEEVAP